MKRRIIFLLLLTATWISPGVQLSVSAQGTVNAYDRVTYLEAVMDMVQDQYADEITDQALYTGALRGMFQSQDQDLLHGALKGVFSTMDPFTMYWSYDEYKQFAELISGENASIGVEIHRTQEDLIVTKVEPLSPAQQAGVQPGDRIVAINGNSIAQTSDSELMGLLAGEAGTKYVLSIVRNNNATEIEVVSKQTEVIPVTYQIRDGIGYIKFDIFSTNALEYMNQALEEMDKNNITKIVLDLRDNPGGDMGTCVGIAKKFVPKGLIVKADYKSELFPDQEYYSDLEDSKYTLAVLVNGMSASASEALSGAIQDTKAGVLIGTKTYGKAKIQVDFPLLKPDIYEEYKTKLGVEVVTGRELLTKYHIPVSEDEILGVSHITIGRYTTPNGRMIDEKGLTPDIYIKDPEPLLDIDINTIKKLTKTSKPYINDTGMDIFYAENILKLSGYEVNTPDTVMDEKTALAVAKFQKDCGLYPYGVLDFTTQQALNDHLGRLILEIDTQYAKAVEYVNHSIQ